MDLQLAMHIAFRRFLKGKSRGKGQIRLLIWMSLTRKKIDNLPQQEVRSVIIKPKNKMFKYLFKYIGICRESGKQITMLFLVCRAELSSVRYKTGARP